SCFNSNTQSSWSKGAAIRDGLIGWMRGSIGIIIVAGRKPVKGVGLSKSSAMDWSSTILSLGKSVEKACASWKKKKRQLQSDFILDAIGLQECLSPDTHEAGT